MRKCSLTYKQVNDRKKKPKKQINTSVDLESFIIKKHAY